MYCDTGMDNSVPLTSLDDCVFEGVAHPTLISNGRNVVGVFATGMFNACIVKNSMLWRGIGIGSANFTPNMYEICEPSLIELSAESRYTNVVCTVVIIVARVL